MALVGCHASCPAWQASSKICSSSQREGLAAHHVVLAMMPWHAPTNSPAPRGLLGSGKPCSDESNAARFRYLCRESGELEPYLKLVDTLIQRCP